MMLHDWYGIQIGAKMHYKHMTDLRFPKRRSVTRWDLATAMLRLRPKFLRDWLYVKLGLIQPLRPKSSNAWIVALTSLRFSRQERAPPSKDRELVPHPQKLAHRMVCPLHPPLESHQVDHPVGHLKVDNHNRQRLRIHQLRACSQKH